MTVMMMMMTDGQSKCRPAGALGRHFLGTARVAQSWHLPPCSETGRRPLSLQKEHLGMILLLERKILSKPRECQREELSLGPLLGKVVPSVPLEGKDSSETLGLYSSG